MLKTRHRTVESWEYDDEPHDKRCLECGHFITYTYCQKCQTYSSSCPCGWMDHDCLCKGKKDD